MATVFTIGIFLCFFLQFLLLSKPKKSISDKILAIWMFVLGMHLFSYFISLQGYWDIYPGLAGLHHPLPLFHGPFLYLYVLFSLRTDQRFSSIHYVHFLPPFAFYVYMIPFFFFYSAEEKAQINSGQIDDYSVFIAFSLIAFLVSGVGYAAASYRLLSRYKDVARENYAYRHSIDLVWLKNFIIGMGLIFGAAILLAVLQEWIGLRFGFNTDIIFYSLIILFIFYLGYSGIMHQGIFSSNSEHVQLVESKNSGEYRNSGLKEEDALLYHGQLKELMEIKKPHLEPKLSLVALAEYLDISPNYLSQIINQYEGKNFYDFVNQYRVEEFKERAKNPENSKFSLLAIAYDSGFNSKSSFNEVFKKNVGKTPSQYLNSIK